MKSVDAELKYAAVSTVLKIVLCLFGLGMIWLDVGAFHTDLLETSFTEIGQELLLFCCALIFLRCSAKAGQKGFSLLAAGFFACLLMRELDGLFDPISHSAWCWPFMAILLWSLRQGLAADRRADTLAALGRFVRTPSFGAMVSGGIVLVFSRVFGMGELWHQILQGGYARLAKTMVEEGLELLAYMIWFAASIEHARGLSLRHGGRNGLVLQGQGAVSFGAQHAPRPQPEEQRKAG